MIVRWSISFHFIMDKASRASLEIVDMTRSVVKSSQSSSVDSSEDNGGLNMTWITLDHGELM